MNAGHYAVVVGIDEYPGGFTKLEHAVNDATEVAEWLATDGGVPHLTRVIQAAPDHPVEQDVYRALKAWRDHVNAAVRARQVRWEDTRLYLYVSGHGLSPGGGDAALLTADASHTDLWSVSLGRVRDFLEESQEFREIVVFADCCRDDIPGAQAFGPRWTRGPSPGRGRVVWAFWLAAAFNAKAYEAPAQPGDLLAEHGYFTRALLEGLRGEAADGGVIDSRSLGEYVERRVVELLPTRRTQYPSTPCSSSSARIVFWRAPATVVPEDAVASPAATFELDVRAAEDTRIFVFDADKRRLDSAYGKVFVRVEPGRYTVELVSPTGTTTEEVDVTGPTTLDLGRPVSVAAMTGSAGSNEGHQEAAHHLAADRGAGLPTVAVVVRRRRDEETRVSVSLDGVSLPGGQPLPSPVEFDGRFAGASAAVPPGPTTVKFPDGRRLPLWLPPGWITYVFAPADAQGRATLDGASIHLREAGTGVTPHEEDEEANALAEYALLAVLRGVPTLSASDVRKLLHTKWRNPMAGVLGAHALLLEEQVDWDLLDEVVANLTTLVPGHPDLAGVRAVAARRGAAEDRATSQSPLDVEDLPTVWRSWEGLLWLDRRVPGTVRDGSQAEALAMNVAAAGPWLATSKSTFGMRLAAPRLSFADRVREWAREAGTRDLVEVAAATGLPMGAVRRILE